METFNQYGHYLFDLALIVSLIPLFGLAIGFTLFRYSLDYFYALRGTTLFAMVSFMVVAAFDYYLANYATEFYLALAFTLAYLWIALSEVSVPRAFRAELKV